MTRFGFVLLALHLLGSIAAAAEGINLSWDDCGSAGVSFKTFACDDNAGAPDIFVASFSPPPGIDDLGGVQGTIDIRSSVDGLLPDWWRHLGFLDTGLACRDSNGMSVDADFGIACDNPFAARAPTFAELGYKFDYGPDRVRVTVGVGYLNSPYGGTLSPGREYYAFRILMTHYRSTGVDSCAGCSAPACIVLNTIQLFDQADFIDPEISLPLERNHVTWQTSLPDCPLSTQARRSTWGQIKNLYR